MRGREDMSIWNDNKSEWVKTGSMRHVDQRTHVELDLSEAPMNSTNTIFYHIYEHQGAYEMVACMKPVSSRQLHPADICDLNQDLAQDAGGKKVADVRHACASAKKTNKQTKAATAQTVRTQRGCADKFFRLVRAPSVSAARK